MPLPNFKGPPFLNLVQASPVRPRRGGHTHTYGMDHCSLFVSGMRRAAQDWLTVLHGAYCSSSSLARTVFIVRTQMI